MTAARRLAAILAVDSSQVGQPQAPQRCPSGTACACFTLPSRVWATLPFPLSAAGRG
jgi:hypothetical protein